MSSSHRRRRALQEETAARRTRCARLAQAPRRSRTRWRHAEEDDRRRRRLPRNSWQQNSTNRAAGASSELATMCIGRRAGEGSALDLKSGLPNNTQMGLPKPGRFCRRNLDTATAARQSKPEGGQRRQLSPRSSPRKCRPVSRTTSCRAPSPRSSGR